MKKIILLLITLFTFVGLFSFVKSADAITKYTPAAIHIVKKDNFDLSTKINPTRDEDYQVSSRLFQSMAKIQVVGSRIYAGWITGGDTEPSIDNYLVICYSDDDGKTWVDPYMIIDHDLYDEVSIGNSALFLDDSGKFWIMYYKKGAGLYAITSTNADSENIDDVEWSKETFINDYGSENRPTILSTGEWLYTSRNNDDKQKVPVISSVNHGKNFFTKGNAMSSVSADYKFAGESAIIEKENGVLVLYSRIEAYGGIERYYSYDEGASWTKSQANLPHPLHGPGSRFVMIKLPSGNWLFVTNDSEDSRCNLTAYLSKDEGETWTDGLLLDPRLGAEYPDASFDSEGNIYVIYDQGRTNEREIRVCKFTEKDLEASKFVSEQSLDKVIITKINPNYIDIVDASFNDNVKTLSIGSNLDSYISSLPKKITIYDSNGNSYELSGTWKKGEATTSKVGTYYLEYSTTLPEGLQDTYGHLLVCLHVKEETKSGCNGSINLTQATIMFAAIMILIKRKGNKNEED